MSTFAIDPTSGRYICDKDHPMPKDRKRGERWIHTNVVEDGEQTDGYPGGDIQRYKCLDCGHTWKEELPE
jgi:hypothetical protein